FVRTQGLKSQDEWHAYRNSGRKPRVIPSDPNKTYGSVFRGYGDWLGTGTLANQNRRYRPFAEDRDFVHQLGLKSLKDWRACSSTGQKPEDIPSNPDKTYGAEFKGMGDWLGTRTIATHKRRYRPFAEARDFVRTQG